MVELSHERVEQILHDETPKTTELATILRSIYTRYMRLCEKYFADIDALNDDVIAELKQYHEETKSLVKYYYMDIPHDVCVALNQFDEEYASKLLMADWNSILFEAYDDFRDENKYKYKNEGLLKAEFRKENLAAFYETMGHIFRVGFGTGSKTIEDTFTGLAGLLFGKKE